MGEIQRNLDPAECRHNTGDLNVADDVPRGVNGFRVKHLIGAWSSISTTTRKSVAERSTKRS